MQLIVLVLRVSPIHRIKMKYDPLHLHTVADAVSSEAISSFQLNFYMVSIYK